MQVNLRREQRRTNSTDYRIVWRDQAGVMHSTQARGQDISSLGINLRSPKPIPLGSQVFIEAPDHRPTGYTTLRHCREFDGAYVIGLEFGEDTRKSMSGASLSDDIDYYEFLQISPKAEFPTIQRIYRFMAGRFHTDNPETGDPEKFILLKQAYEILSDPEKRAEYDAKREVKEVHQNPIFDMEEFVNGVEGEVNRRLGVLSLLYNRRRTNSENPKVSLYDLEKRMGWPREYLDFTTWYLRSKQFITREDNSDFSLTALGVDFIEQNYVQIPMLQKLLNSGSRTATSESANGKAKTNGKLLLTGPADGAAALPDGGGSNA
ncbi:MAG TPA: DnaJ domain-containing protein [Candidatus Sulfopaludibacter sp.]|jgi:curved DNA-binding protein CbpA|nr:DnaJ domain-containing protein [Candidatus Sulfopaludibacter sp.]